MSVPWPVANRRVETLEMVPALGSPVRGSFLLPRAGDQTFSLGVIISVTCGHPTRGRDSLEGLHPFACFLPLLVPEPSVV